MAVTTGILGARTLAADETRASFERPYGLAWLLQFRTRRFPVAEGMTSFLSAQLRRFMVRLSILARPQMATATRAAMVAAFPSEDHANSDRMYARSG